MNARGPAACLALFCVCAAPANAQPVHYHLDPAHTRVEFSVVHLGVLRAQGQFTQVTGSVDYDAARQDGRIGLWIYSDPAVEIADLEVEGHVNEKTLAPLRDEWIERQLAALEKGAAPAKPGR